MTTAAPTPMPMRPWYRLAQVTARLLYGSLFNFRIHGADNVPPGGGVLLACNHVSFLDPHAVGAGCPREACFLARKTLFVGKLQSALLRSWNVVPVDLSGKPDITGLKAVLDRLRRGYAVTLFPEGTRTHDGGFQEAKPGVGLLVAKAGVPVVPVRLFGAYEAWPRNQKLPRRGQVDILFGKPLHYDAMIADARAKGAAAMKDVYQRIADDVMEHIKALRLD
ncbi:MAG: 1-acyl-sn-glycerol-3-phosphate acyltransferase [Verrucomicrobia bacterium]|nr:1-acyl-sn-glycerol-3-phosphate acyltransferase [Verrucomicrobiota bacterium]